MIKYKKIVLPFFLFINFLSVVSQARVFDFKSENLAAYFHATGGYSTIGNEAYANSSGSGTVFTDTVPYLPGFELGFLFGLGEAMTVKLAAEVLQTKELTGIIGKNSSGTELFKLNSKVFGFNPNFTIEFDLSRGQSSRSFFAASMGWIVMSLDNGYTFSSAAALTELSVAADYIEKSEASFVTYSAYFGYEILALDNVTFMINTGYRYIPVTELTYKHDYPDLIGTTNDNKLKGDVVVNDDGTKRTFDFGGPFVGIGFRFYISFM